MEAFEALSVGDKLRVRRGLRRGEAPLDPRLAAPTVELAESYQRQGRTQLALQRWLPLLLIAGSVYGAISSAIDGDQLGSILSALIALGSAGFLLFDPVARPKNMVRALETSRRVVAPRG